MLNRRVVITGIGMVTPLGIDIHSSWTNLIQGKSGIKIIDSFDVSSFSSQIAGVIDKSSESKFHAEKYVDVRDIHKMDLFIQYGIAAATQAIEDSGWIPRTEDQSDRTGVILGAGIGGLKSIEDTSVALFSSHKNKVSPFFIPSSLINLLSGHVSIKYGFTGPNTSIVTACATGAHAIGDASRMIKHGYTDVMIAGGSEAPITPIGVAGFASAKALSTKYNNYPDKASRPWDIDRDGFIIAEGAGVVVLEEYNHAIKRNANIYGELVGYGSTADAYHITSPHPHGLGAEKAIKNAINEAQINVSDINYINAHGTSTVLGDKIELDTVQKVFLEKNPKIIMSSTKSSTGHLLGAAGSVELIFSLLAIKHKTIPPTLNLHNPIPNNKIDLVALESRTVKKIEYVLSNSFGFGGTNASIIIKKI